MTKGPVWTTTHGDTVEVWRSPETGTPEDFYPMWYWRRFAKNGKRLCWSGEGYQRRVDCLRTAERVNPRVFDA